MDQITLQASPRVREAKGSNRRLRSEGRVPAVVYGGKVDPRNIAVDHHELELILRGASRTNAVFNLQLQEDAEQTIVRDIQRHPVNNRVVHVDFQRIDLNATVTVEVAVHVTGKIPVGVRGGGILEHVVRTLTIECRPLDIPKAIEADLTDLEMNHSFHVRDLSLPEGISVLDEPETALFVISPPATEVAAVETTTDAAEPEVIAKKKEDADEKDKK